MIYIILPIYNEARIVASVVDELRRILKKKSYCIVAIDDGSTDDTRKILKKLKHNDLLLIGHAVNMNIGVVFAAGIDKVLKNARDNDAVVIMESDQTSSADAIMKLTAPLQKGIDVVIASRYKPGGGYGNFPLLRHIFSFGANFLMRLNFPIDDVWDYTIFFRSYRAGILRKARKVYGKFGLIQSKGFVANAELLVKLSFLTKNIVEVPFLYDYGKKTGKSKIGIVKTINEYFVVITYLTDIRKKLAKRMMINS